MVRIKDLPLGRYIIRVFYLLQGREQTTITINRAIQRLIQISDEFTYLNLQLLSEERGAPTALSAICGFHSSAKNKNIACLAMQ